MWGLHIIHWNCNSSFWIFKGCYQHDIFWKSNIRGNSHNASNKLLVGLSHSSSSFLSSTSLPNISPLQTHFFKTPTSFNHYQILHIRLVLSQLRKSICVFNMGFTCRCEMFDDGVVIYEKLYSYTLNGYGCCTIFLSNQLPSDWVAVYNSMEDVDQSWSTPWLVIVLKNKTVVDSVDSRDCSNAMRRYIEAQHVTQVFSWLELSMSHKSSLMTSRIVFQATKPDAFLVKM